MVSCGLNKNRIMEYKLSEQELKDLMHRSWLKAKNFYSGNTDEYFYDYFESEKKQLTIHGVMHPLPSKDEMTLELNTMLTELNKDVKPSYLKRSVLKGVEIGFKKCYEYVKGNCA